MVKCSQDYTCKGDYNMATDHNIPSLNGLEPLPFHWGHRYFDYLPTSFDDSLSFTEQIAQLMEYLNKMHRLSDELVSQWEEIKEWIMNDGVTNSVEKVMQQWVKDGTISKLISDNVLTNIWDAIRALASGSPKGVFATVNELRNTYPNGDDGIYITTDTGHWWYWNDGAWTDGGQYQSTGIADHSITNKQLALDTVLPINLTSNNKILQAQNIQTNKIIRSYNKNGSPVIEDQNGYNVVKYMIPTDFTRVEFRVPSNNNGQFMLFYHSKDDTNMMKNITAADVTNGSFTGTAGRSYVNDSKTYVGIYGNKNFNYDNDHDIDHVWISYRADSEFEILLYGTDLGLKLNFWDGTVLGTNVIAPQDNLYKNRFRLNQFNIEPTPYYRLAGIDSDTKPKIAGDGSQAYLKTPTSVFGDADIIVTNYSDVDYGQFVIFTDADDKQLVRIDQAQVKTQLNGVDDSDISHRFITVVNNEVHINYALIRAHYPTVKNVWLGYSIENYERGIALYTRASVQPKLASNWVDFGDKFTIKSLCYETMHSTHSLRYITTTGLPELTAFNGTFLKFYNVSPNAKGTMSVPKFHFVSQANGQFLYRLRADGTVIHNVAMPAKGGDFPTDPLYTVTDDSIIIDFTKFNPGEKLMLCFPNYILDTYYEYYYKTHDLSTFDWYDGTNSGSGDSALTDDDINIPAYIPMVNGKESYVYYDNILLNHNLYAEHLPAYSTNQRGDKQVLTGNGSDSTTVVTIKGRNISIPIKGVSDTVGGGKTYHIMAIGESTTVASHYLTALKADLDADTNLTASFIGSKETNSIAHEAHNGWGAGTLRYMSEVNGDTNAFVNPATNEFDFNYYTTNHSSQPLPDIVLINFGINDVNRYVTNGRGGTQTEHFNFFINQIKAKAPNCIFIIALTHSYNRWTNYWSEGKRDDIMKRVKQTNADFGNRESEGIFLNPWYVAIDMRHDFDHESVNSNQFNTTDKIELATNTVHPANSGYQNNALMTYMAIKYGISKR